MTANAASEMPKLALVQLVTFGSLNDTLNFQDVKMMLSRKLRSPITHRLVAQSCRSRELQANTITATLIPKHSSCVEYPIISLTGDGEMANLLTETFDYQDTTGNNSVSTTPPRVTLSNPQDIFFLSKQQSYTRLRWRVHFVPSCTVAMLHA